MTAEDYWVYHNRQAPHRGAIIHRGDCRDCNHGRGRRGGTDPEQGQWHGPLPTLQDAWHHAYGLSRTGEPRECAHCIRSPQTANQRLGPTGIADVQR